MENSTKLDSKQLLIILNHAEKLLVEVRSLSYVNQTDDFAPEVSNKEEYHLERLRNTEVLIIICVLLLWCGSIWIFIRHSELLRIRYRHIPYNPTIKSQTNLSHINVVHRLSDTIIHAKPTSTSATTLILTHPLSNRMSEQGSTYERKSLLVPQTCNVETNVILCDSNPSIKCTDTDDQLLDPHMIPRDVRRRLLDVHRKSVGNLSGMRYSISFPSHDLSIQ